MSDYHQVFYLALLQGLTEFLPVSSAAVLTLLPRLLGWGAPGLSVVIAAHLGSLFAVVVHFRAEIFGLAAAWVRSFRGGGHADARARAAWGVVAATFVTAVFAAGAAGIVERELRAAVPIAVATLVFGALLAAADWRGRKTRAMEELRVRDAVLIGCAQALAVAPGVSRSGVTISAALALGFTREAAARFSFLLAAPVILLAAAWQMRALLAGESAVNWGELFGVVALSAVAAFVCIRWFLAFVRRHSLVWFAAYRVLLGVVLLAVFL